MAINPGFTQACTNLAMGCDLVLLLVVNIGLLVFFAKDWKLGLAMGFVLNAGLFMWYYQAVTVKGYAWFWGAPLITMFLWLIIMALTLYTVNKTAQSGRGFI